MTTQIPTEQREADLTEPRSGPFTRVQIGAWLRRYAVYVALFVLILVNLVITPGFGTSFTVRNLLFDASPVILIAVGVSLAIGARGIDLSVGSVMALSSAVISLYLGYGAWPAAAAAIIAGGLVGLFNGTLIAFVRINPLISGLALLVAARGLAQAMVGGSRTSLPLSGLFTTLGTGAIGVIPYVTIVALAIALAIGFAVRRTTFGHYVLSSGANPSAAFLAGAPIRRTLLAVYLISGTLAGLAGVFASARIGASDPSFIGLNFELTAIAAAVIGGTSLAGGRISVLGAVVGALFLQVLDVTFIMNNINSSYAQIFKAAIILVALYLQRSWRAGR